MALAVHVLARRSPSLIILTSKHLIMDPNILYAGLPKYIIQAVPGVTSANLSVSDFVKSKISSRFNKEAIYDAKIQRKVLVLENIPQELPQNKIFNERRQLQNDSRLHGRKKKSRHPPMTSKERKRLHIYGIPKKGHKYELFLPLHRLWIQYMNDLHEGCTNATIFSQKLLKADYHGAMMTVSKAKCPTYVGVTGIVVSELQNIFQIITPQHKVKHIPKRNCQFCITIKDYVYTLYGDQIACRAADRAVRKYKAKPTMDII